MIGSERLYLLCCDKTGKRRYETRARARIARRRHGDRRLNIYRCGHCSDYHLGHLTAEVKAGEMARPSRFG